MLLVSLCYNMLSESLNSLVKSLIRLKFAAASLPLRSNAAEITGCWGVICYYLLLFVCYLLLLVCYLHSYLH